MCFVNNITGDKMGHKVDLSKYKIRTDLAVEVVKDGIKGVTSNVRIEHNIKITDVDIDYNGSKMIGKKPGSYITIEFEDITDKDNFDNVLKIFIRELKTLINKFDDGLCLVVGLGNSSSTPDALGPKTVNKVMSTNQLYMVNSLGKGYRRVSTFSPGVMGENGIETSDLIKSVVNTIHPNLVIVIDALASQSIDRVNKTIQMTDSGISPGSGIGNARKEISMDTLNLPVIAIGVPTVVDAVTIVSDTINYMYKHYAYALKNKDNPINKLMINTPNYLKSDIKIDDNKKLFGIIGNLNQKETKELVYEVLTPIGYNLMVTTKEIDYIINKLSNLISIGINKSLHKNT